MRVQWAGLLGGALLAGLLNATSAVGTPNARWMSDDELNTTFRGRSIAGEYENGDVFHETYTPEGLVSYRDAMRESGGKWSIRAGTFCTIYDHDSSGGCYRVRQASDNCFEFHFVARTTDEAEKDPRKPDWTARGWFPDKPKTCVDGQSV